MGKTTNPDKLITIDVGIEGIEELVTLPVTHEMFCRLAVFEKTNVEAYMKAFPNCKARSTARTNSCRLAQEYDIQRVIEYYRRKLAERIEVTEQNIIEEYGAIAFIDISDILNSDGTIKPLEMIPRYATRAISEYNEKVDRHGTKTVTVKFHNKLNALQMLAAIKGIGAKDENNKVIVKFQ